MKGKWTYVWALLAVALLGFYLFSRYRVAPAIDFTRLSLTDLNGTPVNFDSLKGKRLIVSFGASWCGNCIEELGTITALKDTELSELQVLVISDEPLEKIERFSKRFHPSFTYLHLNGPFSSIGINAIPTTYLLTKNLEVKKEKVGYIDWNDPSTREHLKKLTE